MPDSRHSGRSGTRWRFMAITWEYSSVSLGFIQVPNRWLLLFKSGMT